RHLQPTRQAERRGGTMKQNAPALRGGIVPKERKDGRRKRGTCCHSRGDGDDRALSASLSAFHARSAHFTRTGKRATPARARRSPSRRSVAASGSPCINRVKSAASSRISARVFPSICCAIMEADACEIEHPCPVNRALPIA